MNNIVPDSVNDRINVLFKQLNSVNKTIKNINSDYLYDSSDHSLVIKGSSFTINTDNSGIFLGDKTTPDSMILYGTDDPTTISISGVPNGSLYLTKDKLGAGYIKTNGEWLQLATTSEDINVNGNMNVSGNVIVGDNIYVEKNTDIYGDMNVSGDVVINGNLDVDTSIYANDLNIGSGKTIITSDINTEEINATSLSLTEDISCNGNIISSGSITAENLNINSKFNIDSSGNLDTSGYINLSGSLTASGNIDCSGLTAKSLNINSKFTVDSSGNVNADGDINILGDLSSNSLVYNGTLTYASINTTGQVNASGNITTNGSLSSNTLNVNSNLLINNAGNLDTSGTINASGNISGSTINNLSLIQNSTGFSISGGTTSKTLTVNNTLTLAGTDNTTMTFPSTSQTIVGLTSSQAITNKTLNLSAGNTVQAPLQFTSSANLLILPIGGSVEYDGTNYYATSIDSNNSAIRKILPNTNYYRITSDRSITTTDTVNVFPLGTFRMDANAYYIIDWHMFWNRTNASGTHTYSLVTSGSPQFVVLGATNILSTGTNGSMNYGITSTTSLAASETMGLGNYYHSVRAYILSSASISDTIKLQVTQSTGNLILKQGSHIFINRMPNNNFGSFT